MDIAAYLESGVLEEYCLGLLSDEDAAFVAALSLQHPEVKRELDNIEMGIERFAALQATEPRAELKNRILSALSFSDSPLNINNLPVITQRSNADDWLKVIEHLIPAEPHEDFICDMIRQDANVVQMFVVTRNDVPEEIHTDMIEGFYILQGQCRCKVGNNIYTLDPGDFLEIPLHTEHDIKILSSRVVAILQHRLLAS
jgi:mannose-6-phosphate isomerase-like protein (cupin superfamily)